MPGRKPHTLRALAPELRSIDVARWIETFLTSAQPIDVGPRPARVGHLGRLNLLDRLEGPPLPVLVGDLALGPLGHATARGTGPRRALLDPLLQHGHLILGQPLALGRHLLLRVGRSDAGHHLTVVGFAGDDGGLAGFRGKQGVAAKVEAELAFAGLVVRAVAFETVAREERADVAVEIDFGGGGGGGRGFGGVGGRSGGNQESEEECAGDAANKAGGVRNWP